MPDSSPLTTSTEGAELDRLVLSLFSNTAFQSMLQLLQKPLQEKIDLLEKSNLELKQKVNELEKKTCKLNEQLTSLKEETKEIKTNDKEQQQQNEKRNNLIFTGIPEEENEDLNKKITEYFEAKFEKKGVQFKCERMGKIPEKKSEDDSPKPRPRPIKVLFSNFWDKRSIYNDRIKSLKNTGMYLNEDLIPSKAKLAFIARKLKREGKIHSTFTNDGQVYIRKTDTSEAIVFNEEIKVSFTTTTITNEESSS